MATQLLFPNQPPQFLTAPSYVLGRGADCDILLPEDDAGISRHHARLERDDNGAWWLGDSSTNGTRVNGRKLDVRHQLRDGDRVEIGAVQFSISAPQPARVAAVSQAIEIAPVETPRSSPTTITPRAQLEERLAKIEAPNAPAIVEAQIAPAQVVQAQVRPVEIIAPTFTPAPGAPPASAATSPAPMDFRAPEPPAPSPPAVEPNFEIAHFEPTPYSPPQPAALAPVSAPAPQPASAPQPAQNPPFSPVSNPYAPPQSAAPQPVAPAPIMPLPPQPIRNQKSPGIALLLSFFFWGGGQFYNGQIGKGVAFMAGGAMLGISTLLLGWIPVIGWLIGFGMLVSYVFNLVDAYGSAERINRDLQQQQYNQQVQNQLNAHSYNAQLPR